MRPIRQEDISGCAIACVAFILKMKYVTSLKLFKNGHKNAARFGFSRKEIVRVLNKTGLNYRYKYISDKARGLLSKDKTIVFIKRSKKYPLGHYLCRAGKRWMDPWINSPEVKIKAGYRRRLPGKPIYLIFPVS